MLLIKNATLVQFPSESDPAKIQEGVDILVDGSEIVKVESSIEIAAGMVVDKVIDAKGKLVMPGMVCSHNHFYSGLARGIMADIKPCPDFVSTLQNLWWKLDRALDQESLYYSGLICSLEAIKSGCTSVIDHHASPNFIEGSLSVLRDGFIKAGLRGMTCYETTDRNGGLRELERGVEENVNFANLIDSQKDQSYLVEAHIGAHAPFTVADAGLELMGQAVKQTGRGIHIHVAEDKYDVSHSRHMYGMEPLARLDKFGLLNHKSVIGHALFLEDGDIELLNQRDGFLVHNARSNMNNGVGYNHKLGQYRNLALGTDGIGADMFEELKMAFFKHRDAKGSMWPDSFLKFLNNGNQLLERNFDAQFGKIEPGYKADILIYDYTTPTPLVADNLPGHMAFGMNSSGVRTVIVDGKVVLENSEFPFDVSDIYAEAAKQGKRLWSAMDQLG
ncbi:putative aminohydrolase SsnA [Pelagibaculum spongiae]|uniref:Putative aminohydrolase SsnA n=1 Tax=Pelagibaculum spongiae TaxID=2080658 RepID=A0A2V1H1K8_9GAMM|nr:putative aminohydrolase SsnA [Pelagibaculum spongiae]PVZ72579.1 putative aminohydrolase SsnA [Pelagibaculum spongiae]